MKTLKILTLMLTLLTGLLFFAGCQQETVSPDSAIDQRYDSPVVSPTTRPTTFYGLGTKNELYTYTTSPVKEQSKVMMTGLQPNETMRAIDIRPATKQLYGVSNQDRIYVIEPSTGQTKPVSTQSFTPGVNDAIVGFDFKTNEDRILIATNDGQNIKIDPTTGQAVAVTDEMVPQKGINGMAHTTPSTATAQPALYKVDGSTGDVYRVDAQGNPILVGSTGLKIDGEGGFDIMKDDMALGAFKASGMVPNSSTTTSDNLSQPANRVYSIDLKTGQATNLGTTSPIVGMAIRQ